MSISLSESPPVSSCVQLHWPQSWEHFECESDSVVPRPAVVEHGSLPENNNRIDSDWSLIVDVHVYKYLILIGHWLFMYQKYIILIGHCLFMFINTWFWLAELPGLPEVQHWEQCEPALHSCKLATLDYQWYQPVIGRFEKILSCDWSDLMNYNKILTWAEASVKHERETCNNWQ